MFYLQAEIKHYIYRWVYYYRQLSNRRLSHKDLFIENFTAHY